MLTKPLLVTEQPDTSYLERICSIIRFFCLLYHSGRMKNLLPNITDTAQATSGPFPEFLGSDTPPSTATSLATRIMPGFAKVKPIVYGL